MKKILLSLKDFAIVVIMILTTNELNAADRYAVANGNWNATTTWSATAGGSSGASVPVAGDNVYIVGGFTVTVPNNVTAACTNLFITIASTAGTGTLSFGNSASTLNVSGDVVVGTATSGSREGVITMTSGGVLNITGNLTIGNEGSSAPIASEINQGANSSISVTGNVSILTRNTDSYTNRWQVNAGTATVGGTLTLANTSNGNQDCNVIITTGSLGVTGAVTMNGAANENSISITGAGTLNLGNSISATNGTFSISNTSTVNYNGSGAQTLRAATYQNLTFGGSSAKTFPASTTVNGKLLIQGSATVAGTAPTYGANAVLEYNGSVAQNTTNIEFPAAMGADLIINNASGVTLNGAKTLSASLTLTDGVLTTTGTNLLIFPDNFSTVTGGSTSSYVSGPVRKNGNNAFTFPVGKDGVYSPVTITAPDNNADAFTCEYKRESAAALGNITVAGIFRVSNCEYWELTENNDAGGVTSISLTVGWYSNSGCGPLSYINDYTGIRLVHFDGSTWDAIAGSAGSPTGSNTTGTITRTAVTNFSPFALGTAIDNANPLPVTFADVKAFEKGNGVQIEWANLTEKDVVNYTIERSPNGNDFVAIGQQAARSNQTDKQSYFGFDAAPVAGTNFYRIKVVEVDGKIIYSKLLRVDIGRTTKGISLYPNPVSGTDVTIGFTAVKGLYTLRIMNAAGQQVSAQQIVHPGGNVSQAVAIPATAKPGFYVMLISGDNFKESKSFVIQ